MTLIIQDNFDAEPSPPTLTQWEKLTQDGGAFAVSTTGAGGSAQSIVCSSLSGVATAQFAYLQKTFIAVNAVRARAYLGFASLPSAALEGTPIDIRASAPSGYGLAWTYINIDGKIYLRYNTTVDSRQTATGFAQLAINTWYLVEVKVGYNTATAAPYNGYVELWVNGVLVASAYEINNTPVGQPTIAQFGLRYVPASTTTAISVNIDEVYAESIEEEITYTLTLVQSSGGTISSPKTVYSPGETATVTASPTIGMLFDHWLIDSVRPSAPYDTQNPVSAEMNDNHDIQAVFVTAPPSTLPFHDTFIDLSNWYEQTGTWTKK